MLHRRSRILLPLYSIDWPLLAAVLLLAAAGLVTMHSFSSASGNDDFFFNRQLVWIGISVVLFFAASFVDWRFLRTTRVVVLLYALSLSALALLFLLGTATFGAVSRFDLGSFFVQPSDPVKLVLVFLLAKYFSRRHVEIAHYRHIVISGMYTLILGVLLFLQPDFGSAVTVFLVWFGMVFVSGLSKKHLLLLFLSAALAFTLLWNFGFADYQKQRVLTFLNPLTDLEGAGYNAYQSMVAVGSGELFGKGIGYGTQSRLAFLPAYETDFIFAAFAEEWGFVGALLLLLVFGFIISRILREARHGETNFEILYALGFAILLGSHLIVHVGMNIGLLPVTGIVLPFLSYGGSHLVMEFLGLGILMGMRKYRRAAHLDDVQKEFVGPQ